MELLTACRHSCCTFCAKAPFKQIIVCDKKESFSSLQVTHEQIQKSRAINKAGLKSECMVLQAAKDELACLQLQQTKIK